MQRPIIDTFCIQWRSPILLLPDPHGYADEPPQRLVYHMIFVIFTYVLCSSGVTDGYKTFSGTSTSWTTFTVERSEFRSNLWESRSKIRLLFVVILLIFFICCVELHSTSHFLFSVLPHVRLSGYHSEFSFTERSPFLHAQRKKNIISSVS